MPDTDTSVNFPSFAPGMAGAKSINRFQGAFPDPYLDYASTQMPRSIYDVLRWAQYTWLTYGTYRQAAQRVVRYFLTNIELNDVSEDERKKYDDFFRHELKIMDELAAIGDEYMQFGNSFVSLNVPFRRYLRCPKAGCGFERPIDQVNYTWEGWRFHGTCPACGHHGVLLRQDRRSLKTDKLKVIRWSPMEMRILHHPTSGRKTYFWDIPGYIKDRIRKGDSLYMEDTPWEIIEAVKENKLFRFADDVIFHLCDEAPAGMRMSGWGIPLIMSNFKQAWYIQVLKRFNEAIALDYLIPFRIITPAPGSSREADPALHINMGLFHSRVLSMFRHHRKDPTAIHALPFPIKMDMLGADGKALAPTDLIDKATDEFLNAQGVPAELYRGSLSIQAAPMALRLFERTWVHLVSGFNNCIRWICTRVSSLQNWENLDARLEPTTLADDIEKKSVLQQLAAGQQISQGTAMRPFGINYKDEFRRRLQEEAFATEEMTRFQEEQQQRQSLQNTLAQGSVQPPMGVMPPGVPGQQGGMQQGGMPMDPSGGMQQGGMPGGMPMGMPMDAGGGSAGVTPDDLVQQAEQYAYQMLQMPYELRRGALAKIKKSNETLHSLVIAKMRELRQTAAGQGGFAQLQAMVAAPGGAQAA
jgi:hypothetical protein